MAQDDEEPGRAEDGLANALSDAIEGQLNADSTVKVAIMRLDTYKLVMVGLTEQKLANGLTLSSPVWSTEISNHAALAIAQNLMFLVNQVVPCKEHGIILAHPPKDESDGAPMTAVGDEEEELDVQPGPGIDLL